MCRREIVWKPSDDCILTEFQLSNFVRESEMDEESAVNSIAPRGSKRRQKYFDISLRQLVGLRGNPVRRRNTDVKYLRKNFVEQEKWDDMEIQKFAPIVKLLLLVLEWEMWIRNRCDLDEYDGRLILRLLFKSMIQKRTGCETNRKSIVTDSFHQRRLWEVLIRLQMWASEKKLKDEWIDSKHENRPSIINVDTKTSQKIKGEFWLAIAVVTRFRWASLNNKFTLWVLKKSSSPTVSRIKAVAVSVLVAALIDMGSTPS